MNEILHYFKLKNLPKISEKYVFHWEELNFEHIGSSVHAAGFLALGKAPNIYITLREKCPNTEFFLVRIFLYSD